MARKKRIDTVGTTHHIIIRGNNKENIFGDGYDKEYFLYLLLIYKEKFEYNIFSYVLMDNHVHQIIETKDYGISQIVHSILSNYSKYFNKKYGRINHVFNDRFKSIIVDSDRYLLTLCKYIHNNPVKAGIASDSSEYIWSSYNEFIGKSHDRLTDCDRILNYFSKDLSTARNIFNKFISSKGLPYIDISIKNRDIEKFINENFIRIYSYKYILDKIRYFYNYTDIDFNIEETSACFEMKYNSAYLLSKYTTLKQIEIANIVGLGNQSAVSRAIKKANYCVAESIIM